MLTAAGSSRSLAAAITLYVPRARTAPPRRHRRRNIPSHFTSDFSCVSFAAAAAAAARPPRDARRHRRSPSTTGAPTTDDGPPVRSLSPHPFRRPYRGRSLSLIRSLCRTHAPAYASPLHVTGVHRLCQRGWARGWRAGDGGIHRRRAARSLLAHNGRGGGHSIWLPYRWSSVARPFGEKN